jgi:hypothetical protein
MEIFVSTRQGLLPDPEFDEIAAIFYVVYHDGPKKNLQGIKDSFF